jgi:S-DNA-T family DNA segregation ATPase FtsK/SpoIIIE
VEAQVDCGKIGRTSDEVVHAGMQIAAFMKADHVSVATVSPGHARLVLNWGDPTGRELTLSDMPAPQGGHICFGLDPDSDPVAIRADRSLLCVGETGSGKSNIIWALLAGLNEAGVPYRLRIIDPAGGVEFTNLEDSPRTKVYVDRANKAEKVITDARDAMNARLAWMKKHNVPELVEATPENPLDITIIDELLLLGDMIKKGVLSPIGEVLSVGRKGLYVVWALSQLSQVDTLGRIRDLFAQRLCLSTGSREMTEAALGPSAEAMGAKCSKIPLSTPGVGYRYLNGQKGFTRFRSVHVPKKGDTRYQIAQGGIPSDIHRAQQVKAKQQRDLQKQRTAVYRLRDRKGVLLYVGITNNPTTRMAEHAAEKVWWTEVDQSQTSISWYGNRAKAKAEETKAITSERPRWNVSEATEGAKQ